MELQPTPTNSDSNRLRTTESAVDVVDREPTPDASIESVPEWRPSINIRIGGRGKPPVESVDSENGSDAPVYAAPRRRRLDLIDVALGAILVSRFFCAYSEQIGIRADCTIPTSATFWGAPSGSIFHS